MLREVLHSRTIRSLLVVLALMLLMRGAFELFLYREDRISASSASADERRGRSAGISAPPQAAPVQPPAPAAAPYAKVQRQPQIKNVKLPQQPPPAANAGAPPESPGASLCAFPASESQVAKLLQQIATAKLEHPELNQALVKLEEQLFHATGGQVCMQQLQQTVKTLCDRDPDIEEALKAVERTLPLIARVLVGDPCNEDLGTLLGLLDRLSPGM